jgi:predicted dehydrogenase
MDAVITERSDLLGRRRTVAASAFFLATMWMSDGLNVQLSATAAGLGSPRFEFTILGSDGELHFDLATKLTGAFRGERGKTVDMAASGVCDDEATNSVSIFASSFRYFAPRLVDAALTGDHTGIADASTFQNALDNHAILDAIRVAAKSGEMVVVKDGYSSNAIT